jgi:hypothetical protein
MGKGPGSIRRRACGRVFVAGLLAVLALPCVALAANTAAFTTAVPKSGSVSVATSPKISVTVYDRYGVKGSSSYALYVDGVKYRAALSYVKGYGYRKFKLTYTPAAALRAGAHTIRVTVHDLKHRDSAYSWGFSVLDVTPPVTTSDAVPSYDGTAAVCLRAADDVAVAHTYFIVDGGPQTSYTTTITVLAEDTAQLHSLEFWSTDAQGNTEAHRMAWFVVQPVKRTFGQNHTFPKRACTLTGCHSTDLAVIHAPSDRGCNACHATDAAPTPDCTGCHGPAPSHPGVSALHAGDKASCIIAGCHAGDVSVIHATSDRSCSACHGTGSPATKDCTSIGCHAAPHPSVSSHDTSASTCVSGACHSSGNAASIHASAPDGCATCHTGLGTPTGLCAICHVGGNAPVHASIGTSHTAEAGVCVNSGCHVADVSAIHVRSGRTCRSCHATGVTASRTCANCHTTDPLTFHTRIGTKHDAPAGISCINANCHSGTVAAIHKTHCSACHGPGITATTTCDSAACHHQNFDVIHARGDAPHAASGTDCSSTNCHVTNLVTIHSESARSCSACHAVGTTPSALCPTCHVGGTSVVHTIGTKHTPPFGTCVSPTCHNMGVAGTHIGTASDCSSCHVVGTPPSLDCAACHVGSRAPTHTIVGTRHTVESTTCVGDECHSTNAATIHEGSHLRCAACHGLDKVPSLDCVSCHATQHTRQAASHEITTTCAPECHPGAADTLHKDRCSRCHFRARPASLLCADCHSEHDLPAIHASTVTSGTVTISNVSFGKHRCDECHASADLIVLHGGDGSCASCHPTRTAPLIGAWNGTCAVTNCHIPQTGVRKQHGKIDASHTLDTVPSCVGAACHGGGTDGKNAAALHKDAPLGCRTCHRTGVTLTLVCATDGCHPDGKSALHDGHAATVTTGTISIGTADYGTFQCSACHPVTELQALHGGAGGCAKCHPDPAASAKPWLGGCQQGDCHKAGTALALHGSIEASHTTPAGVQGACGDGIGCHGTMPASVAAIHASHGGCVDCHDGHPLTLVCSTCHDAHDLPALHAATMTTSTITIKTHDYGTHGCSECHASTDLRTIHATGCGSCHPGVATTLGATWDKSCAQGDCHKTGTPLALHGSIDASHTAPVGTCVTSICHLAGDVAAIHDPSTRKCQACHDGGTLTLDCTTTHCHGTEDPHPSHASAVTSATFTILGADFGKHRCDECHADPDLRPLHGDNAGCGKCHPTPRSGFGTWNKTCVQGDCHKVGTALAMHGSIDTSHTLGTAPACIGTGCHDGGTDGKNVAAFHKDAPRGCATCHRTGITPTLICATDGCHPDGKSALHDSHAATITSGTITINLVGYGSHRCDECHAITELQALHGGSGGCANCHPDPAASAKPWLGGCQQGDCHKVGTPLAMHGSIDTTHVAVVPACVTATCHVGGDVAALHNGSLRKCQACHDGGTLTLDCTTAHCHGPSGPPSHDSHPATITSGTITINLVDYGNHQCSECHHTTELQEAHGETGTNNSCAKCHPNPAASAKPWLGGCQQGDCHKVGTALAMHGSIDTTHVAVVPACVTATCHVGGDVAALHVKDGIKHCDACHDAVGTPLTTTCTSASPCHGATLPPSHVSHPAILAPAAITGYGGADLGSHHCSECHVTDLQLEHGETGAKNSCAKCHPTPRNSFTLWNETCTQGNCHAGTSPLLMHGHIGSAHMAVDSCHDQEGSHGSGWTYWTRGGNYELSSVHRHYGCATCHGANSRWYIDSGGAPLPATGDCWNCHNDSHC